jgi:hypothetical protein
MPLGFPAALVLAVLFSACNRDAPIADRESQDRGPEVQPSPPFDRPSRSPQPGGARSGHSDCDIRFADATESSEIQFVHDSGARGKYILAESISAGMATIDFDSDGVHDLYFLNSGATSPRPEASRGNELYRGVGGMRFTNAAAPSRTDFRAVASGVAVADFDQDGFPDIYLNNVGPNCMLRNNGDGTFSDVSQRFDVQAGDLVGAGVTVLDSDGQGLLDIYVANYAECRGKHHVPRTIDGYHCYPGPLDFEPTEDVLFEGNADGSFNDTSLSSGIRNSVPGTGMGVVSADLDEDGHPDIFVANDMRPNTLLANDGAGRFEDTALLRGVAYNYEGRSTGNMGVDVGDYNNDGLTDLFTTTYSRQLPTLYQNLGDGQFRDATLAAHAATETLPHVNWGCGFGDFNNDGFEDLFVANGDLEPMAEKWKVGTAHKLPNQLLMNNGHGRFQDVSDRAGDAMAVRESSRGAVIEDLDFDGLLDIVVLNSDSRPTVMRNTSSGNKHWVAIQVRGTQTNRDGIGSKVLVTAGGTTQLRNVVSGRGYQSHFGSRLHFGLGDADHIERIEVQWRSGGSSVHTDLEADQLITLVEGRADALRH